MNNDQNEILLSNVNQILEEANVTISFRFVKFSESRNKKEKNLSLNWAVTLLRNGSPVHEFDYMAGIGHIPGNLHHHRSTTILGDEIIRDICETGKFPTPLSYMKEAKEFLGIERWAGTLEPSIIDVLYSLMTDSDALNYASFEDWADSFGYDTDSIKADMIYRKCLQTALVMRSLFNDDGMAELRELFEDY